MSKGILYFPSAPSDNQLSPTLATESPLATLLHLYVVTNDTIMLLCIYEYTRTIMVSQINSPKVPYRWTVGWLLSTRQTKQEKEAVQNRVKNDIRNKTSEDL